MKRMLLSGGLLASDAFAHASEFLSGGGSYGIQSGLHVLASIGLLVSVVHFAKATITTMMDQPETFSI